MHTHKAKVLWYERDERELTNSSAKYETSLLLFPFLKTSSRQLCCHPWLPQESPLHYFISSMLVPCLEKMLNFFLLMLFLTLRSRKNVPSLFICMSFQWNCIEFIQRSCRIFATIRNYFRITLECTLVFVRTECKSAYSFCSLSELYLSKALLKVQSSQSSCFWCH